MTREQTIEGYLINSPRVVAEMLYDTITQYEQRIAELETNYTDLEYNSACILEYATGGRASKPHIKYEVAHRLIDDNIEYWIKEHKEESEAAKTCNGCKYFDDEFKECGKTLDVNVPAYVDFMGCGLYEEKDTE